MEPLAQRSVRLSVLTAGFTVCGGCTATGLEMVGAEYSPTGAFVGAKQSSKRRLRRCDSATGAGSAMGCDGGAGVEVDLGSAGVGSGRGGSNAGIAQGSGRGGNGDCRETDADIAKLLKEVTETGKSTSIRSGGATLEGN